ncbi:MAG: hypothetical protein P9L99_21140 [Candidatus Lernaella stagnicola]|nr:hypothetical protein [Candidatus Lernaella stagnicola]
MNKKTIGILIAVWIAFVAAPVFAHSISVWASVENGKVVVDAYGSGGAKLKNIKVYVLDAKGEMLLQGKTDDQGRFVFDPPAKDDMTIIVKSGASGEHEHTAEAKIKKSDFDEAKTPPATDDTPK